MDSTRYAALAHTHERRAADFDQRAERLQREIDHVATLLVPLEGTAGPRVWVGPAAERHGDDTRRARRQVDAAIADIEQVVHLLRARARVERLDARAAQRLSDLAEAQERMTMLP